MTLNYYKDTVKQRIGTIALYDLNGTFDEIIQKLQEEKQYYVDHYVNKAAKVHVTNSYRPYLDGEKVKEVKFDKIYLDLGEDYGDKVYEVWGERKFLPEEIEAQKEQEKKLKADKEVKEKEEYERLKKKFS